MGELRRVVEIHVPRRAIPIPSARRKLDGGGGNRLRRQTQWFYWRLFSRALRRALLMRVDPAPPNCSIAVEVVLYEWWPWARADAYLRGVIAAMTPSVVRSQSCEHLRGVSLRCEKRQGGGFKIRVWVYNEADTPPPAVLEGLVPEFKFYGDSIVDWAGDMETRDHVERLQATLVEIDEAAFPNMKSRRRKTR